MWGCVNFSVLFPITGETDVEAALISFGLITTNWSYCMCYTSLVYYFFLRPCKNSNRRKLSVLGQYDIWQYLLSTTKRQLEKVNQVTWFSVEVWMHLFVKRVHCAWHKQAVTPFLTRHHIPVRAASLLLLFLHIAEFKHRSPMFALFLSSGCCIYHFLCWPRRRTKSNVRWIAPIHRRKNLLCLSHGRVRCVVSDSVANSGCYFGETIGPSHR